MKNIVIAFCLLFFALNVHAQTNNGDVILHQWKADDKSIIQFEKSGNTYFARVLYGSKLFEKDGKTYKKDVNNPNPALRSKSLQNHIFIYQLGFKNNKWTDGKVNNYEDGHTYEATITISNNVLNMRVYKGFSLLGKTVIWYLLK